MKECTSGASPRGTIALVNLARSHALLRGRTYVLPDDIKYLAPYVLGHRIILTHEARIAGRDPKAVITTVLDSVAVPALTEEEAKGLS
jgi:MoxR-like ATPase